MPDLENLMSSSVKLYFGSCDGYCGCLLAQSTNKYPPSLPATTISFAFRANALETRLVSHAQRDFLAAESKRAKKKQVILRLNGGLKIGRKGRKERVEASTASTASGHY